MACWLYARVGLQHWMQYPTGDRRRRVIVPLHTQAIVQVCNPDDATMWAQGGVAQGKHIPMALCLELAFVAVVDDPNKRKGGSVPHVVLVVGPLDMYTRVHRAHVEYPAWREACSKASAEEG